MLTLISFRKLPLLLYIIFPALSRSIKLFNTIPLNIPKTITLSSANFLDLKIMGNSSLNVGSLRFFLVPLDTDINFDFVVSGGKCEENLDSEQTFFRQVLSSQSITGAYFNINASKDYCFKAIILSGAETITVNCSMLTTFTSIENVVHLNIPSSFELSQGKAKEFACDLDNNIAEMVLISITTLETIPTLSSYKEKQLQFAGFAGLCLNSSSSTSWLCYLKNTERVFKFSLSNPGPYKSFQINITSIQTFVISPDIEGLMPPSISGFGAFFSINLAEIGILNIKAKSLGHKRLPIVSSLSLHGLFANLFEGRRIRSFAPETEIDSEGALLITNKWIETQWYYFIPATGPERFFLSSIFTKMIIIEADNPTVFYLDPKISEYQMIQFKTIKTDIIEKYEATLESSQPNVLMRLHKNSNPYEPRSILDQDTTSFCKENALVSFKKREISLSFAIVGTIDPSAYLTIHACTAGFYTLKVSKVSSEKLLWNIWVIIVALCVVLYIALYCYIIKKAKRLNEPPNQFLSSLQNDQNNFYLDDFPWIGHDFSTMSHIGNEHNENRRRGSTAIQFLPQLINNFEKVSDLEKNKRSKGYKKQDKDLENQVFEEDSFNHDGGKRCDICYETRETVIFGPCKHACACSFCALVIIQTSAECPLCRTLIRELVVKSESRIE